MVRLYLWAWLLTVNMKLLFSQHGSGKGNLCVSACVFAFFQEGDPVRSEGWERCWELCQTTHHLIMLECAATLCIFFSCVGARSCCCTSTAREGEREGLTARKEGMTVWWREEESSSVWGFFRFVKSWVSFSFMNTIMIRDNDGDNKSRVFCFACSLRNVLRKSEAITFETT